MVPVDEGYEQLRRAFSYLERRREAGPFDIGDHYAMQLIKALGEFLLILNSSMK